MKKIKVYEKVEEGLKCIYCGEERRDHENTDLRYVGKADNRNYLTVIIPCSDDCNGDCKKCKI